MSDKIISLRDANQRFAEIVRQVESGRSYVVTRRGVSVARIVPVAGKRQLTDIQKAAWARAEKAMRRGWHLGGLKLDRDKLYDDV